MQPTIEFILKNKEWLFSGIGVFVLSGVALLLRHLLFPMKHGSDATQIRDNGKQETHSQKKVEYRDYINVKETYELPFDDGYKTKPLILADGTVCRMDTQLVMEVSNATKAFDTWKEDHPLNLLSPVISSRVHQLLEASTFAEVRARRKEFEEELLTELQSDFGKRGFKLESFIIGAVEPIGHVK